MPNAILNRKQDQLDKDHVHHERNDVHVDADASSCVRCGGFLVSTYCLDLESSSGDRWCRTLRCVQCGELLDPVILHNRRHSLSRLGCQAEWVPQYAE